MSTARGDGPGSRGRDSGVKPAAERSVVELDRVGVARLEREAIEAGLRREPSRQVAPTEEHTGSDGGDAACLTAHPPPPLGPVRFASARCTPT